MLKKFSVKNYRNFANELTIDFSKIGGYQFNTDCITEGLISKMLIYGRNATGKTNLGRALGDIANIVYMPTGFMRGDNFLNADSQEDVISYSYLFQVGNSELTYHYSRYSNMELRDEELYVDGIKIYKCDFENKKFDFINLTYIDAETANTERYLQTLTGNKEDTEEVLEQNPPFLRWLINSSVLKNDSLPIKLALYVRQMCMISGDSATMIRPKITQNRFYEMLADSNKLQELEDFLNRMGVECKLEMRSLPNGQKELYFAHQQPLPFYENASSGTKALVELYRRVFVKERELSLIYLDEFDAFYHYEMAEQIVIYLKSRYPKCQVIMTTHNTNLMTNRLMRPDCLFILSRAGSLTALCNATSRELREGHNLEKMYISGEFRDYE